MGLFTDRCRNPECRSRVSKLAEFCSQCGTPAPRATASCGECGASVGARSRYCWHCSAELTTSAKPVLRDNTWSRRAEEFAVLVEDADVKGWLTKPLTIAHGTRALLFQRGQFRGEIGEGTHDMNGLLTRLNHFLVDQAATVMLVDAGDVTLDLANDGLWTADGLSVSCASRVVLRIEDPDKMLVNLMKGKRRLLFGTVADELSDEVDMHLSRIVGRYELEELFRRAELRDEVEAELRAQLTDTLDRLGMSLVQVRFIDFASETYASWRAQQGEMTQLARDADREDQRTRLNQRLRETLTADRMHAFQDEREFESFVRQAEHELGMRGLIRDDEMTGLKARLAHDRQKDGILRAIELATIQDDAERDKAFQDLHAEQMRNNALAEEQRRRELGRAANDLEVEKIRVEIQRLKDQHAFERRQANHRQDMIEAREGWDLTERMQAAEARRMDQEVELEARRLQARSDATTEALLSIVGGDAADKIVQIERLRMENDLTPEQMLARAKESAPAFAKALEKKYEADGQIDAEKVKLLDEQLQRQRTDAQRHAEQLKEVAYKGMDTARDAAVTRARPTESKQTIVTGGHGRPTVVNPEATPAFCPHCDRPIDRAGRYCAHCGEPTRQGD
jgi:hypothetical protein